MINDKTMKNNILKYALFSVVLLLTGVSLNSCNSDDSAGGTPMLSVFGPSPALRGGDLRFLGVNMKGVTGIKLQGADEIKDFTSQTESEVDITIPQSAEPGLVTINYDGGSTVTKSELTFTEPISVDSTYCENKPAPRYGDKLIITGDYLNLIKQAIFMGGDTVMSANFISQSRKKIELTIPRGAKAGHLTLSNGATIPVTVFTPAVAIQPPVYRTDNPITPLTVKPGKDSVDIYGANLDLVKAVTFAGTKLAGFRLVSQTQIRALVPLDAQDGKVILVAYASGLTVTSTVDMAMEMPAVTSVSPIPVKNGGTLVLSGTNLDLVTAVSFGKVSATISSQSETQLKITVPIATNSTTCTLTMASTKTLNVTGISYIEPTVTTFNPSSLTAGESTTLTGTDLDLVSSVTFSGSGSLTVSSFASQTSTSLALAVPVTAVTGTVTLNLVNGNDVSISSGLTIKPATDPAISGTPQPSSPGKSITITGRNLNSVEAFYLGTTKITKYTSRGDESVTMVVPSTISLGTYAINMVDYSGNTFTGPNIIIQSPEYTISKDNSGFTFPGTLTWADGGRFRIYFDSPVDLTSLGLTTNSKIYIYKNAGETGQAQINDANWSTLTTATDWDGSLTKVEVPVTSAILTAINSTRDNGTTTCLIIQGSGFTVSKVTILP